ncbi:DNA-directed RNA polymerase subunit N [Candidatus Woesearchaeota archaeon]|nr:DNA-directed RNA polymerase subunit N [Candidatus Woesearchaeota archaeon]
MIIPVRCWSDHNVIGHLWEEFVERVQKGEDRKKILDDFGLTRYCCRAMFLGHVDLLDTAAEFKKF